MKTIAGIRCWGAGDNDRWDAILDAGEDDRWEALWNG